MSGPGLMDMGDGRYMVPALVSPTTGLYLVPCVRCDGTGWIKRAPMLGPTQCTVCRGRGTVPA